MSNANTGGPAFPFIEPPTARYSVNTGMTLRDYFAAKAMQGELACQRNEYEWRSSELLAGYCYNIADAMLKAREA